MPVGSGTSPNTYTGNGVTTVFAYQFTIVDEGDLVVTVDGVVSVDYTVSDVGEPAGGSVTFGTAPANGTEIVLTRAMTLERTGDFQTNGDLLADTLDYELDRLWLALIDSNGVTSTALRFPFPEVANELPADSARLGKYLKFNASTGQPEVATTITGGVALSVGAFTPTLVGSSSAGVGTYDTQVGNYVKLGDDVAFVSIIITWSAHTGSGYPRISGLPFAPSRPAIDTGNRLLGTHSFVVDSPVGTHPFYVSVTNDTITPSGYTYIAAADGYGFMTLDNDGGSIQLSGIILLS